MTIATAGMNDDPVTQRGVRIDEVVVSPYIFFVIHEGQFVAWNFKTHRQFALDSNGIRALIDPDFRKKNPAITSELIQASILDLPKIDDGQAWGWDLLSKIFHIGTSRTKPSNFTPAPKDDSLSYVDYCASILDKMPPDAFETSRGVKDVELTFEATSKIGELRELLAIRCSNRTFTGEAIPLSSVAVILDETFRYRPHDASAYRRMGMFTPTMRRSSPSGGSLQSCEAYIIARKVIGLAPGFYHFSSHKRNLGLIEAIDESFNLGTLLGGQMFAEDLSAAIVVTCRFDKLMWKYRQSRSYRVALLDAGHLSQTAQLVATSLGVRTWLTAAFFDEEMSSLLCLDTKSNEYPLLVIGLGAGEYNPFDKNLGEGFVNRQPPNENWK